MFQMRHQLVGCALALGCALAWGSFTAHADHGNDDQEGKRMGKVFVIGMENHNWTQPNPLANPQQIYKNPAAPFINSLANGTSGISDQVAYATKYLNAGPGVHPSEPNYVWAEAGQAFKSIGTDADPYNP